jgi:hypothetical protein
MSKKLIILAALAPWAFAFAAVAPDTEPQIKENKQISAVLSGISSRNIEATIRKLVSFGTRHTLSDAQSDTRGIGAARRWIQSELERYSKENGGRLEVTLDDFTQPPGERNPQPVQVVNVVATLRGTQPESRDRIYVVSGHYDSRVTDVMNATADAPGADDDASGVAAVMEMARVMSKKDWDATLVFMSVAGEEQGLFGSTHWAKMAKEKPQETCIRCVGQQSQISTKTSLGSRVAVSTGSSLRSWRRGYQGFRRSGQVVSQGGRSKFRPGPIQSGWLLRQRRWRGQRSSGSREMVSQSRRPK